MIGRKTNRLTIIALCENKLKCIVQCDCGNTREVYKSHLSTGGVKECKICAKKSNGKAAALRATGNTYAVGHTSNLRRHNESGTRLYACWNNLKNRCSQKAFEKWYGNIAYCERWKVYENFKADMEATYFEEAQIDRIDPDGNYEPGNCQWLTASEHSKKTAKERNR